MMKNEMFIRFTVFFFLISSYAQELTVNYFDQFVYPESVTVRNEYYANLLYFNGKSIYFPADADSVKDFEEVSNFVEGEIEVTSKKSVFKFSTINFKNIRKNYQVTQIAFAGNKYLISEKLRSIAWTITEQEKIIGTYNCRLAVAESKGVKIEAWFTEEIPVASGPAEYGGLPGLILEVKKGIKHILAKNITFTTNKELIKPPVDGNVTSRKEYDQMMDAKRGIKEKDVSSTEVESFAGGTKTTTTRTVIKKNSYRLNDNN